MREGVKLRNCALWGMLPMVDCSVTESPMGPNPTLARCALVDRHCLYCVGGRVCTPAHKPCVDGAAPYSTRVTRCCIPCTLLTFLPMPCLRPQLQASTTMPCAARFCCFTDNSCPQTTCHANHRGACTAQVAVLGYKLVVQRCSPTPAPASKPSSDPRDRGPHGLGPGLHGSHCWRCRWAPPASSAALCLNPQPTRAQP